MQHPGSTAATAHYLAGDLEWAIYSPPLLKARSDPDLVSLPQNRKIIERVRQDPSALLIFLEGMKRQNLGTYFEHLIFFWLHQLDDVQLLGCNVQVHNEKETLGEFDVLFTYQGQSYHWELAVKFYANTSDGTSEENWVGPLKRDNLGKKLNRLFDHQLRLGQADAARALLSEKSIRTLIASPFIKGMLFDRAGTEFPSALPERISSSCTLSNWCTPQDLLSVDLDNATHYCCLYKPRWISIVESDDWKGMNNINTLISILETLFKKDSTPVLVAFGRGIFPKIEENARLFVMPGNWAT